MRGQPGLLAMGSTNSTSTSTSTTPTSQQLSPGAQYSVGIPPVPSAYAAAMAAASSIQAAQALASSSAIPIVNDGQNAVVSAAVASPTSSVMSPGAQYSIGIPDAPADYVSKMQAASSSVATQAAQSTPVAAVGGELSAWEQAAGVAQQKEMFDGPQLQARAFIGSRRSRWNGHHGRQERFATVGKRSTGAVVTALLPNQVEGKTPNDKDVKNAAIVTSKRDQYYEPALLPSDVENSTPAAADVAHSKSAAEISHGNRLATDTSGSDSSTSSDPTSNTDATSSSQDATTDPNSTSSQGTDAVQSDSTTTTGSTDGNDKGTDSSSTGSQTDFPSAPLASTSSESGEKDTAGSSEGDAATPSSSSDGAALAASSSPIYTFTGESS